MIYFKQVLTTLLLLVFCAFSVNAQDEMTKEQLLAKKAELDAEAGKYASEAAAIQAKLDALPGWRTGLVGNIGLGLNGNNNWYALTAPNASSNTIGLGVNAFANNIQDKYFWRNLLNVTVQRSATTIASGADPVIALAEGLDLSSLFGYNIMKNLALSAEGKYTTSLIQYDADGKKYRSSINDPGKITVSAGLTYTGIKNLVLILHPLGYELNFPGDLISAPGAKLGAIYNTTLFNRVGWTSNLSAFIPYTGAGTVDYASANGTNLAVDYGTGDLFNYTWINGFSANIFKGIAVSLNLGLRGDNQIADRGQISLVDDPTTVTTKGLKLQSYYTLGLGYTF